MDNVPLINKGSPLHDLGLRVLSNDSCRTFLIRFMPKDLASIMQQGASSPFLLNETDRKIYEAMKTAKWAKYNELMRHLEHTRQVYDYTLLLIEVRTRIARRNGGMYVDPVESPSLTTPVDEKQNSEVDQNRERSPN